MTSHPLRRTLLSSIPLCVTLAACGGDGPEVTCADGLDLGQLGLAGDYCVVARVTAPSSAAFTFGAGTLWSYGADADASRTFTVAQHDLDLAEGTLGDAREVLRFTVDGDEDVYPGQYLAHDGSRVAVGYTLANFSGQIRHGVAGAATAALAATGNFDAVFLDGGGTLLVDGLGLGESEQGQGLYVAAPGAAPRLLISDLGDLSGFVARGSTVLFVGGAFGTFPDLENKVFAFSLDEVRRAVAEQTTLSAASDGDMVYSGPMTDLAAMGDDLLVIDDDFTTFNAVARIEIAVDGDTVVAGSRRDMVTPGGEDRPTELAAHGAWIALRLGEQLAFVGRR